MKKPFISLLCTLLLLIPLAGAQVYPPPPFPELPPQARAVLPPPPFRSIAESVVLEVPASLDITLPVSGQPLAVRQIRLLFSEGFEGGQLTIHLLSEDPYGIEISLEPLPTAYQLFFIEASPSIEDHLERAIITFSVPISWLNEYNVDKFKTLLLRYVDTETAEILPTTFRVGVDEITYTSHTGLFSLFVIAGPDPPWYPPWVIQMVLAVGLIMSGIVPMIYLLYPNRRLKE